MQQTKTAIQCWEEFLLFAKSSCSPAEFENWIASIEASKESLEELVLFVPNIFVQNYLLENYKNELFTFIPTKTNGELFLRFVIAEPRGPKPLTPKPAPEPPKTESALPQLNPLYLFENFIEGSTNQFVKSAALGVAAKPGRSYNPLFIHGGVGLGKTHLLHAICHFVHSHHKRLKIQLITAEGFINDLVDHLRSKSTDKMKRFYRSLDVLLIDDIQFLQNRLNFEEEFCNTFEALIHQNKQIVITSDKPPSDLKLSERMVARMQCGLVASVGVPELETRVAILQHKAEQKGLRLPSKAAFFIAERIFNNVRQLEGALNRLAAHSRMLGLAINEETVEKALGDFFLPAPMKKRVSIDAILKNVSAMFDVSTSDLCSTSRCKHIALPRQIAMYLAKELINESLIKLGASFGGKTHSTLLHAWKKISDLCNKDEKWRRQIELARRNLEN